MTVKQEQLDLMCIVILARKDILISALYIKTKS